jgi:hypothetical protein
MMASTSTAAPRGSAATCTVDARGIGSAELRGHGRVDRGKVREIGQEDGELDDLPEVAAGGARHCAHVAEDLLGLRGGVARAQFHGCRIERDLPRHVDQVVDLDGLRVGSDRLRRPGRVDHGAIAHARLSCCCLSALRGSPSART